MSKSSSIFMALPKMKMYCMRFANSQKFRSLVSKLCSCVGCSEDSISSRPRLRRAIESEFGDAKGEMEWTRMRFWQVEAYLTVANITQKVAT